jgi:predicted nucleic acid-binding protein
MGPKQGLVLLDTNIFVIDLRYKRDVYYKSNRAFLDYTAQEKTGFTTIVNLLELCGILSFNLNESQLTELWFYFQDRYKVTVLPVSSLESEFPSVGIKEILELLKNRASLGDALMVVVAQKHMPFISTMVTWDKDHLENIFPGTVLTPQEFLQSSNAG